MRAIIVVDGWHKEIDHAPACAVEVGFLEINIFPPISFRVGGPRTMSKVTGVKVTLQFLGKDRDGTPIFGDRK